MTKYNFEFPIPDLDRINKEIDLLYAEYKKTVSLNLSEEFSVKLARDYVNELHEKINALFVMEPSKCEFGWKKSKNEDDSRLYYFLHIPRCGGHTVNSVLSDNDIAHVKAVNRVVLKIEEAAHVSSHENFKDFFSYGGFCDTPFDPQVLKNNSIKVFSTVRNPYAWLVSMYFFGPSSDSIKDVATYLNSVEGVGNVRRIFPTFKDFFNFFIKEAEKSDPLCWLLPFRINPFFQLWDSNGELIPDKIIKLENVQEELPEFLGINYDIPVKNKGSAKHHYREYYSEEMVSMFQEKFGNLLNYFNYEF